MSCQRRRQIVDNRLPTEKKVSKQRHKGKLSVLSYLRSTTTTSVLDKFVMPIMSLANKNNKQNQKPHKEKS